VNLRESLDFVCQDFRAIFQAPGDFDRPGASYLIKQARERVRRYRELQKQADAEAAAIKSLASKIQATVANADPQRSP
jgi:hypothetical protein